MIDDLPGMLAAQPDFGEAALIIGCWGLMYFAAGAPVFLLTGVAGGVLAFGWTAYQSSEHVARRIDGFEDVPTAKEQGIDIVAVNWRGFYVPKDISEEAYGKWAEALGTVAESEQWKKVMADNGLAPYTLIGGDFEAWVADNIAEIREISQEIGIIQ
jgi:hypothetical protein